MQIYWGASGKAQFNCASNTAVKRNKTWEQENQLDKYHQRHFIFLSFKKKNSK